jgi:uncharacterized protein (DUF488 family)
MRLIVPPQMTDTVSSIWTVGHSTRSQADFLALLTANGIQAVADVRRFPSSRSFPHFNQSTLSRSLADAGIQYQHLPELGGRRRARKDSANTAWRNKSFQGYADHMETEEFRRGICKLLELAARRRTAIMCAEAVWWRCHRALISAYLKSRGVEMIHIMDAKTVSVHPYTSVARQRAEALSAGVARALSPSD